MASSVPAQNMSSFGIGSMTRMVARAYLVADALREAGFKVVMGGPHVTECYDEALGRDGGPRHADAVALGEADATWPHIVRDAAKRARVIEEVNDAARTLGLQVVNVIESPIAGAEGNIEYLAFYQK